MPKITEDQRHARRQQLIDAARRLAARQGYRTLTVDDVCAEAGASKGAFYGYFESKNQLLLALLDEDTSEIEALLDRLDETADTHLGRTRRFLQAMAERGSDPAEVQLRAELWSQAPVDNAVKDHLGAAIRSRRERLAGLARAGIAGGELVDLPANAFGAVIVALADGLILHAAVDPSGFQWNNVDRVIDVIVDALANHVHVGEAAQGSPPA